MIPSNRPATSISDEVLEFCDRSPENFVRQFEKAYPRIWNEIKHISDCKNTSEKIYRYLYPTSGKCEICGKPCTYRSFVVGYFPTCGYKCSLIKYSREKYGVDNPFQSLEVKSKSKKTWLNKYGVVHPNKNPSQACKSKTTKKRKYGSENYVNTQKIKETSFARYGVTNANKLQSTKDKITNTCIKRYGVKRFNNRKKSDATCLEKYGVQFPMQCDEVFDKQEKAAFRLKEYTFPSGKTVWCQGYEPYALSALIKNGVKESDIVLDKKEQPRIFYLYNGKKHRYYIDLFIKSLNKIVEVKSEWTYRLHKEKNLIKKEWCLSQGYLFEFWIFDRKKNLAIL